MLSRVVKYIIPQEMTYTEAVIVLTILQHPQADEAGKTAMFMEQFPDHAALAKEQWQDRYGKPWEDSK
jgi:hypothetical protein